MSTLTEDMMIVHENTDFKVNFAGITQLGEFIYTHGGSVQPGIEYHIHYTNNKEEVFMTGGVHNSSSKIIQKVDDSKSMFSTYSSLKLSRKQSYPKKIQPIPTESDYRVGSFTRYFTQKANNLDGDLFEISEDDYNNKNNLFRYFELSWRLTGTKQEVYVENIKTIEFNRKYRGNENIVKLLFPLQYWNPPKGSVDDIQTKLNRRKIM